MQHVAYGVTDRDIRCTRNPYARTAVAAHSSTPATFFVRGFGTWSSDEMVIWQTLVNERVSTYVICPMTSGQYHKNRGKVICSSDSCKACGILSDIDKYYLCIKKENRRYMFPLYVLAMHSS